MDENYSSKRAKQTEKDVRYQEGQATIVLRPLFPYFIRRNCVRIVSFRVYPRNCRAVDAMRRATRTNVRCVYKRDEINFIITYAADIRGFCCNFSTSTTPCWIKIWKEIRWVPHFKVKAQRFCEYHILPHYYHNKVDIKRWRKVKLRLFNNHQNYITDSCRHNKLC